MNVKFSLLNTILKICRKLQSEKKKEIQNIIIAYPTPTANNIQHSDTISMHGLLTLAYQKGEMRFFPMRANKYFDTSK